MPKIVDHDQYRRELLSRCFDLIAEKGYAAITMRQIAQGLGVSTGTLYHYFPSKESLFEQLVVHICDQDTSEQTIAKLKELPTPAERIQAIFEWIGEHEDYFLHQTLMLVDFCRQRSRAEINEHQTLQRTGGRYEQAIMDALGIPDLELAVFIANVVEGLLLRRLYQGDRVSIALQARLASDMLVAYLDAKNLNTQNAALLK